MSTEYDEQLKIALDAYALKRLSQMPSEAELAQTLSFSPRFERRMNRLIHRAGKIAARKKLKKLILYGDEARPHSYNKRLIVVAIIIALLTSLMSITAARETVIHFIVKIFEKYSTIVFPTDTGAPSTEGLPSSADNIQDMLPAYLPDGYSQKDFLVTDQFIRIFYVNGYGDELTISRFVTNHSQLQIDTEGIVAEDILVRNTQGLFYSNKGTQNLAWQEGHYVYIISGKITKNALLEMAESINH